MNKLMHLNPSFILLGSKVLKVNVPKSYGLYVWPVIKWCIQKAYTSEAIFIFKYMIIWFKLLRDYQVCIFRYEQSSAQKFQTLNDRKNCSQDQKNPLA